MSNLDSEIIGIENEIKNLKISQAKKASILRTTKTYFNVDFELSWDDLADRPVSGWLSFKVEAPSNNFPILCLTVEQNDLDSREIDTYSSPLQSVYLGNYYTVGMRMFSENSSDINATQGGGTVTIPITFSIIGTDEFTITQV